MKNKEEPIEVNEKYTYNRDSDVYIVNLKCAAKPFVVPGYRHREIVQAFSNSITPSMATSELAMRLKIPQDYLEEYKKIFGLTRDSLPFSDEEIAEYSDTFCAERLLDMKKFAIFQSYEKQDWKETQKDASNWREFQAKQLDPFRSCIANWTPPKSKFIAPKQLEKISGKTLVIGLSDPHFGMSANDKYMYFRREWSTKETIRCMAKYSSDVVRYANRKGFKYDKVILMVLGDILHSVNGKTQRGTDLKCDCVKEEQFRYALDSLSSFISNMATAFGEVEIKAVCGNHNYEGEMALMMTLEKAFATDGRIKFETFAHRPASFRSGSTLFVIDHGQDDETRAYVPTGSETKLQSHVQSILLRKPELLLGAKSKLFCMGDKHHWEHVEYDSFEFIMFGCPQGDNDEYSDQLNLHARGRQTCLTLDKDNGLEEIFHVYFD